MRHAVRWAVLGAGLAVVALGVVLAVAIGSDPQEGLDRSALVGKPAPSFAVRSADGTPLGNADIAGRASIVNFWNTWCDPCRDELPALMRFASAHAGDADMALVGIVRDAREPDDAVERYAGDEGMSWAIGFDHGGQTALAFATRGQPETFAISPAGVVVGAKIGPVTSRDLERLLAAARSS